ncbi:hypothetical protein BT67DRAFT_346920, partial [Trichocladium antarcticum]
MPNLVAIDVSVTDSRISLVFSHRAVAAAYAAYLRAQDLRPAPHQTVPGYQRAPQLHTTRKEVSLSLPDFITWFITCRLPDDEDSVTFTFMDDAEAHAQRWADSMVLFERVPAPSPSGGNGRSRGHGHGRLDGGGGGRRGRRGSGVKQMHVRRLWNKERLLKRLEE